MPDFGGHLQALARMEPWLALPWLTVVALVCLWGVVGNLMLVPNVMCLTFFEDRRECIILHYDTEVQAFGGQDYVCTGFLT